MSEKFISRAKYTAVRQTLAKMHRERLQEALPGLEGELVAAAQTGDVAAVRARLQALSAELDNSFQDLLAAAIAELDRED
jgi:hypothetical protein